MPELPEVETIRRDIDKEFVNKKIRKVDVSGARSVRRHGTAKEFVSKVEGRKVAVAAEQLHGAERAEAWQQITTAAPRFARYQEKTDRELPIIRLVPR